MKKLKLITIISFLFAVFTSNTLAAGLTVNLIASDYNGFHTSCFGSHDGYLMADCIDGVAPYSYTWSNETHTQSIYNLAPGYYYVVVTDANGSTGTAEITLTTPEALRPSLGALTYSNGYHVTCHYCADGRVNTTVSGGVGPYGYNWSDGGFTANRTNMEAGSWQVIISDLNGCQTTISFGINAPEREDWQNTGNAGTTSSHYLGTSDNKDLVFKTNASERLRIKSNGQLEILKKTLKVDAASVDSARIAYVDQNGILRNIGDEVQRCTFLSNHWYSTSCNGANPNNIYNYPSTGSVAIGTTYFPAGYKLVVEGKIITEEVFIKLRQHWPDYVFDEKYELRSIDNMKEFISKEKHLPNMPKAVEVDNHGISTGEIITKLVKNQEEQALYIIQLNEQNKELKAEIEKLKNSKSKQ